MGKGKKVHEEREKEKAEKHWTKDAVHQHSSNKIQSRHGRMPLGYKTREGRGFKNK